MIERNNKANGAFSIRHSTRNFPNREGSKVQKGQKKWNGTKEILKQGDKIVTEIVVNVPEEEDAPQQSQGLISGFSGS